MNLTELVNYSSGAVVSKTLIDRPAGTVTLFAFDAGQGLSEHSAPFDALVVVLDGSVEVTIGGTPHRVDSGQAILMPADVPHALRALDGPFKVMLVMVKG